MIGLNRKEKEKLVVDLYENGSQVLKTLLANDAAKLYSVLAKDLVDEILSIYDIGKSQTSIQSVSPQT